MYILCKRSRPRQLVWLIFFAALLPRSGASQPLLGKDSLNRGIFASIRKGSTEALRTALQNGANPNAVEGSYSALMAAALSGTKEQMELLIARGAVVNYQDSLGITALWYSVPDFDKTALLLDHGADPQLRSREGFTVLVKLANFPRTEKLFRLLISKGADPRKAGADNSLLYNAASSCDTAVLGLLLRYGLLPNDTTSVGDYPINSALNFRCFLTAKMLVDSGALVNVAPMNLPLEPTKGITPLMFAAVSDDSLSFFYLLAHGADPAGHDKKGYTVLMFAQQAQREELAMTQALLEHGADPRVKALDGTDALQLARLKGNTASVQLLKKYIH